MELNADRVMQEYVKAWGRSPEEGFTFYSDDVVMHLPGRGSLAGDHRGMEAVIAAIQGLLARTDGIPVEIDVLDRLVSGDRVAMVIREAVSRGEEKLEMRRVNVYTVAGGKIANIDVFEAHQYDVDEFFG